jgi:hypothetical protein
MIEWLAPDAFSTKLSDELKSATPLLPAPDTASSTNLGKVTLALKGVLLLLYPFQF